MEPGGSFLRVQLKGENPFLAASTVNAITQRVVVVAAELKRQKFGELEKILGEQFQHARGALDVAENSLKDFRVRTANLQRAGPVHGFAGGGLLGSAPTSAPSFELRLTLDELRRDRMAIERAMRTGTAEALSVIPAVRESPELVAALAELAEQQAAIRVLRQRHTDASATVTQARTAMETLERQTIPTLARGLVAEMSAREQGMSARVDSAFSELRRLPPLALEEARLERDVASAQGLFTNVQQRYEATRLALVSTQPDVRILDEAVEPQRAAASFGPLVIGLALLASLGLAVMGATVFDRVDPKVRYPEQVTRGMRLPILGAVPHFKRWSAADRDDDSQVIEALRALRLRVLHAHGGAGPVVVTVTSPSMGDGKSFISLNLALAFADAGYRTLLIDGDVRRGTQHRDLAVTQVPGLTDVLAGHATIEAATRETAHTGLSFISAGTRLPRAPELLLSPNLRNLIQRLRITADVIIVDSPPLGAGADPLVLGTACGNLLLVLRSGTTDMPLAMSQLDVLDTLPVRTIGAVLNDVRGRDAFRYYTYEAAPGESPPAGAVAAARWARRPTIIGGRT
jgi:tyrosine-protein kinase Etk/Wzc